MNIVFVFTKMKRFVGEEIEILKKEHNVVTMSKAELTFNDYVSSLKREIKKVDIVYCWFAGWHSAIAVHYAKRYGKKSVVVCGGYDTAYIPEIKYGTSYFKEKLPSKYVLKNCDKILPFSYNAESEVESMIGKNDRIEVIRFGLDSDKFKPKGKKENMVITVGEVKQSNIKRKGIGMFIEASAMLPEVPFVVIGEISPEVDTVSMKSSNLSFTDFVDDDELIDYYQRAKVYCQLSFHEGFGLSLAEAMLCNCTPVVTKKGSIPEVVGDTGYYTSYDKNAVAKSISKALQNTENKSRNRIKNEFPLGTRNRILEILEELN